MIPTKTDLTQGHFIVRVSEEDVAETRSQLYNADYRIIRFGLVGRLFGFYGISTFVGYLMPNLFLYI